MPTSSILFFTRHLANLALEALHKQVLPFLLRRLKEDVLSDLPPKIIQDYYCDLSDLQKQLYEDFTQSHAHQEAQEVVNSEGSKGKGQQHIFQSLQYLRKLCNHPALVLKEDGAAERVLAKFRNKHSNAAPLRDLQHAPKLQALRHVSILSTEIHILRVHFLGNFYLIAVLEDLQSLLPRGSNQKAQISTMHRETLGSPSTAC